MPRRKKKVSPKNAKGKSGMMVPSVGGPRGNMGASLNTPTAPVAGTKHAPLLARKPQRGKKKSQPFRRKGA